MKLFGTICKTLLYVTVFFFTAWILISWWDIVSDNMTRNPQHFDWNFFALMIK